jgi:cytidylate kinase
MPVSMDAIIDRQLRRWELDRHGVREKLPAERPFPAQPVITVSRQHGSRGAELAAALAERFHYTLLHRNVIDRIRESTGYTRRLLEALDEHSRSQLSSCFDAFLGGEYVDESDYAASLFQTVYAISRLGGVVVVGRGANFIIGPDAGVHVRVVAPRHERIRELMVRGRLSESQAAREIDEVDRDRTRFLRKLFARSADDPLAYDLILNQSGRSLEAMVEIVARVAEEKFAHLTAAGSPAAGAPRPIVPRSSEAAPIPAPPKTRRPGR